MSIAINADSSLKEKNMCASVRGKSDGPKLDNFPLMNGATLRILKIFLFPLLFQSKFNKKPDQLVRKSALATSAPAAAEKKPKKTPDKKVNHNESRGAVQQEKKLDEIRPKQATSRTSTQSPPKVDRSEYRDRPNRAEKKTVQSVDSSINAASTNQVKDEGESPAVPAPSMTASNSFSWARERALEQQIESLRETLKDTEERMQSLRLQHDNVSQAQRKLRETNAQMQEDMEHLKIDSQHLRECANILRSELQAARKDRADALEMQKMLQRELDENREAKKKLSAESDANAKKILDLQRQCKEMERIVARKNPSAMSSILGKSRLAPRYFI